MDVEQARRFAFVIDGLRYSFAILRQSGARLLSTLDEIVRKRQENQPREDLVTLVLSDAWTVVDMSHRIRELILQVPGLSHGRPALQIFLRATADAEKMRHHVQHFRTEIPALPAECGPLWGAISWVPSFDAHSCYTLMTGNWAPGIQTQNIVFDRQEGRFLTSAYLHAGASSADLRNMILRGRALQEDLRAWLHEQPNVKIHEAGETPILVMSLRPIDSNTPAEKPSS